MPTDDDAKRIMDADQTQAAAADTARVMGEYYAALTPTMSEEHALALTEAFQNLYVIRMLWPDSAPEVM